MSDKTEKLVIGADGGMLRALELTEQRLDADLAKANARIDLLAAIDVGLNEIGEFVRRTQTELTEQLEAIRQGQTLMRQAITELEDRVSVIEDLEERVQRIEAAPAIASDV